jgi:hypothetical protein
MVEFAYIVAIIQTSIALTRLEAHLEAVNIKLVIQNACLPFLRRAALLVQLVPCEELDTKHYGSGLPLVTKLQLIESKARVGLQDRSMSHSSSSWC